MQSHHQVKLNQKPCVVYHLDQYDRFLIGTYELFPTPESARIKFGNQIDDHGLQEALNAINQRAGKFVLLKYDKLSTPVIDYEYDCDLGGGIFDAKISFDESRSAYTIYAAHSNGNIGIYDLVRQDNDTFEISSRKQIKVTETALLTSIDLIASALKVVNEENLSSLSVSEDSGDATIVVGDSKGLISVFDSQGSIRESLEGDDSIWQVKNIQTEDSNCCAIIVGAENCSWYIYQLNLEERTLTLLHKNQYKDFQAGVTSIHTLNCSRHQDSCIFEMLLGSYDESLHTYRVQLDKTDNNLKPDVRHLSKRSIGGGGIWRIRSSKHNQTKLYIAAMYAGSFALTLASESTSGKAPNECGSQASQPENNDHLVRLLEIERLNLANQPLHYDIDVSAKHSTVCIADFNNSLCLLVPITV